MEEPNPPAAKQELDVGRRKRFPSRGRRDGTSESVGNASILLCYTLQVSGSGRTEWPRQSKQSVGENFLRKLCVRITDAYRADCLQSTASLHKLSILQNQGGKTCFRRYVILT